MRNFYSASLEAGRCRLRREQARSADRSARIDARLGGPPALPLGACQPNWPRPRLSPRRQFEGKPTEAASELEQVPTRLLHGHVSAGQLLAVRAASEYVYVAQDMRRILARRRRALSER